MPCEVLNNRYDWYGVVLGRKSFKPLANPFGICFVHNYYQGNILVVSSYQDRSVTYRLCYLLVCSYTLIRKTSFWRLPVFEFGYHTQAHERTLANIHERAHKPTHTQTNTKSHMHEHKRQGSYTHTYMHAHTSTLHTYSDIHVHAHTYTHTHAHIHTCTRAYRQADRQTHAFMFASRTQLTVTHHQADIDRVIFKFAETHTVPDLQTVGLTVTDL